MKCNKTAFTALYSSLSVQGLSLFRSKVFSGIVMIVLSCFISVGINAQTETIQTGSFIINMGISPQTIGNGLKPYGMIYDLIKNHRVGVIWSINPSKSKDGIDFAHNGISYRGGPFIIPAAFRTPAVNERITYWQGQGVVGATTVTDLDVPVYQTLLNVPRWTLDKRNGKLTLPYFANAGIPPDAHGGTSGSGWKDPADLDCCDDLFVLPHADPIWSTHQRLYTWNQECLGGIWNACHSGSSLENMLDPTNRSQQTNFLTIKDPAYTGNSGNYANSNGLLLWGLHSDGSPPYTHRLAADPVAQYIGSTDGALLNGAEQIFIPRQTSGTTARWNPGANIIAYDPTHNNVPSLQGDLRNAATVMVYGKGFDDPNRGFVMHTAAHSLSKSSSPANIAAQRTFFNFSLLVSQNKAENLSISTGDDGLSYSGDGRTYTFELPAGNISNFNIEWTSTCGGSFSPDANTQTLTFTPPPSTDVSGCVLTVSITDNCGRTTTSSLRLAVLCDYNVTHTTVHPSCFGSSDGIINIEVSGFSVYGDNEWDWQKQGIAQTGSGIGEQISGLSSGSYHVTVTSNSGCSAEFTALLINPYEINITSTVRNYTCYGETGIINVTVSGGTIPYSYIWNDGAITRNRDALTANTYTLTVTDSKGCTATISKTVVGPIDAFTVENIKTDVTCNGLQNGTANITLLGGQTPFNYYWSDGNTNQNRTGLSPGSYILTVTDIEGCFSTTSFVLTQPLPLNLQLVSVPPSCPPGAQQGSNNDGSITLTVTGGTTPYGYLWNDNVTTKDRIGLSAGTFSVTITDARGCQINRSITLSSASGVPSAPATINN